MKSAYYGVIPQPIRHHQGLKANSKLMYAEIMACLEDNGICIKRNIYFSKVLNITKETASKSITELRKYGLIEVSIEYENGTNKFIKRYITPCQNFHGVNNSSDNAYCQNNHGVKDSHEEGNGATPCENGQTLLYNNNNINKIYTNGSKSIEILDELNKKQVDYLKKIVYSFYTKKREQMPNIIKSNWVSDKNLINDSINTLYMIIKLDDYSEQIVRDVIKWAVDDSFWGNVLISLRGLRNKSKNGQSKFTNLYVNYQKGNK